jgi:hypothetical protein
MLHACLDLKAIILTKYHYVLYFLVLAMQVGSSLALFFCALQFGSPFLFLFSPCPGNFIKFSDGQLFGYVMTAKNVDDCG